MREQPGRSFEPGRARQDYSSHPWDSPFGFVAARLHENSFLTNFSNLGAFRARFNPIPGASKLKRPPEGDLFNFGAPERIRTSDPCLRRAVLYPAELRAHLKSRCVV